MWDRDVCEQAGSARVLAAVSFHFVSARLRYLADVVSSLARFQTRSIDIVIFTNTAQLGELSQIFAILLSCGLTGRVTTADALAHPFDLTWVHKTLIEDWDRDDASELTHFIYLEDDERLAFENFLYFLQGRRDLKPYGLFPSFARTEWSTKSNHVVSLDCESQIGLEDKPYVSVDSRTYLNLDNPYSGAFILDREMAREYVRSASFDRDRSASKTSWGVRERAAAGLTWEDPPSGFLSRAVVPVDMRRKMIDPCSWVSHLHNNYCDDMQTTFGKVPMHRLFKGDLSVGHRRNIAEQHVPSPSSSQVSGRGS